MSLDILPLEVWSVVVAYLQEPRNGDGYYIGLLTFDAFANGYERKPIVSMDSEEDGLDIKSIRALLLVSRNCYTMTMSCVWKFLCVTEMVPPPAHPSASSRLPCTKFFRPSSGLLNSRSLPNIWERCLAYVTHFVVDETKNLISYNEKATLMYALELAQPKYLPALQSLDVNVSNLVYSKVETFLSTTASYDSLSVSLRIYEGQLIKLFRSSPRTILPFVKTLELLYCGQKINCIEPVERMRQLEELSISMYYTPDDLEKPTIVEDTPMSDEFMLMISKGPLKLKRLGLNEIGFPLTLTGMGSSVEEFTCNSATFANMMRDKLLFPQIKKFVVTFDSFFSDFKNKHMPFTNLEEFVCESRRIIDHQNVHDLVVSVLNSNPNLNRLTTECFEPCLVNNINEFIFPRVRHVRNLSSNSDMSVIDAFLRIFPCCKTIEVQDSVNSKVDYKLLARVMVINTNLEYIIINLENNEDEDKPEQQAETFIQDFDESTFDASEFCIPILLGSNLRSAENYVDVVTHERLDYCAFPMSTWVIDLEKLRNLKQLN